jgi:hypothetical protein
MGQARPKRSNVMDTLHQSRFIPNRTRRAAFDRAAYRLPPATSKKRRDYVERSDIDLPGDPNGIIDLDAELANRISDPRISGSPDPRLTAND